MKLKNLFKEKGIFSGKKVLAITMVLTFVGGMTLGVAASNHTWGSTGNVVYDNNGQKTTVFNKQDLIYLDDRISTIEAGVDTGKVNIAKKLNEWELPADKIVPTTNPSFNQINTALEYIKSIPNAGKEWKDASNNSYYVKEDGSITTNASEAKKNADGNAEPLKISAATAGNLSAGTSAWVDGSLLIGTGADNKNYYELGRDAKAIGYTLIRVTDKSAICILDENQLNPLVPTTNTWKKTAASTYKGTDGGIITANSGDIVSGQCYRVFDGDDSTNWCSRSNNNISASNPHWICYKFPYPTSINVVKIIGNSTTVPATIQGSNDGESWTDIFTVDVNNTDIYHVLGFNQYSDEFLYFRVLFTSCNEKWGDVTAIGGTKFYYFVNIYAIQFYKTI